jgi:hypothetical protein
MWGSAATWSVRSTTPDCVSRTLTVEVTRSTTHSSSVPGRRAIEAVPGPTGVSQTTERFEARKR